MNEVNCTLIFEYENKKEATDVKESIELDNKDYVKVNVEDTSLICEAKGKPLQLLHTVDDLLMCVNVAEKSQNI